jgi:hypothetical protein
MHDLYTNTIIHWKKKIISAYIKEGLISVNEQVVIEPAVEILKKVQYRALIETEGMLGKLYVSYKLILRSSVLLGMGIISC